jgi:hypothetical protein
MNKWMLQEVGVIREKILSGLRGFSGVGTRPFDLAGARFPCSMFFLRINAFSTNLGRLFAVASFLQISAQKLDFTFSILP